MMDEERVPALDGLRGLAALTVVISHLSNATGLLGGALGQGAGQLGVMLFFVISGYLMGRVYLPRPFSPTAFFRARIARVFPLYLAVVLTSFCFQSDITYSITRANIAEHLLFLRGDSTLWTIPIEVQFYLLFAALWAICRVRGAASLAFVTGGGIGIGLVLGAPDLVRCLPFFLAGLLLFLMPRLPSRLADVLIVPVMALYVLAFPQVMGLGRPPLIWSSPWYLLAVAGLLYASVSSPLANWALGSRIPAFFGTISYSVYLLHGPVLTALSKIVAFSVDPFLFPILYTGAVILISSASYYAIERPARRLINRRCLPIKSPSGQPLHRLP